MSVRWGYSISNVFNVTNGVRQSGILSPKLVNIYIDGLSNIFKNYLIGGSLGGKRINHMLYANDLCIVSLSSAVLQNCYQSVMNIVLVILLRLMLRNLYAYSSNVLSTNTVTTQLYY